MCLHVKRIAKTSKLIVRCQKWLVNNNEGLVNRMVPRPPNRFYTATWTTPVMGVPVRKDGWLFPKRLTKTNIEVGDLVDSGYIHAFKRNNEMDYYPAYAFDVVAYGDNALICRGLYIPDADQNPTRRKVTVEAIKVLLKKKTLRRADVVKLHPQLSKKMRENRQRTSK